MVKPYYKCIVMILCLLTIGYSQYCYGGIEEMIDTDVNGQRYISVDCANIKQVTKATAIEINKTLLDRDQPIYCLYFNGVSFDCGTLSTILGALRQGAALKAININSVTSFKDEDAFAIAEALRYRSNLTELYLWINSIGELGAQVIFTALRTNTTLTTFEIDVGNIGTMGVRAIAEVLRTNQTITDIAIRSNIDYEELYAIIFAIIDNMTLLQIDVNCTENQKKILDLVVQRNTKIAVIVQKLKEFDARGAFAFSLGTHARVGEGSPVRSLNTYLLRDIIGNAHRDNNELYDMIWFGTLEQLRRCLAVEDIAQVNEIRKLQLQIYEQAGLRMPMEIRLLEMEPLVAAIAGTQQVTAPPQQQEGQHNVTIVPQQQPMEQQGLNLQDIPLYPINPFSK